MKWQPIETAPKEGDLLLVISARCCSPTPFVASFDPKAEHEQFQWPIYCEPGEDQDDIGWVVAPTHWLPIPELP